MLRRGLQSLPEEWLKEVREVTEIISEPADGSASATAQSTLSDVVAAWASASLGELDGLLRSVSGQISKLGWEFLALGSLQNRSVGEVESSWERF